MFSQLFAGTPSWFGEVASVTRHPDGVTLQGAHDWIVHLSLVGRSLRIRATTGADLRANSCSLITSTGQTTQTLDTEDHEATIMLHSSYWVATIQRTSGEISLHTTDGRLIVEGLRVGWHEGRPTVDSRLSVADRIYGTGLRSQPVNLRGRRAKIWTNNNPNPKHSGDSSYAVVPFALIHRPQQTYGLFHNNAAFAEFDLGEQSNDRVAYQACAGDVDLYVIPGPRPADVIESYTELSGRLELPPRWVHVFGHSRYGMDTHDEVERRVIRYSERRLPLFWVAVDLDYMADNMPWTWDRERFGVPGALSEWLAYRGLSMALIMDPLIPIRPGYAPYDEMVRDKLFCPTADGSTLAVVNGFAGPAHVPDGANPATIEYLTRRFAEATRKWGVAGWWLDKQEIAAVATQVKPGATLAEAQSAMMGDTETLSGETVRHYGGLTEWEYHNRFCLDFARAAHDGQLLAVPTRRPFVLARAQFAGMQRYAAGWTGDNHADFGSLRNAIPQLINLGLSGLPFYGTDIGGFFGHCSTELLIRWVQFGVFTPLARIHSFRTTIEQTPWHRGDRAREIIRQYLELRSRLQPLTNDLFWDAMERGVPLMRPLFWDYPDEQLHDDPWVQFQFLWGPFLVAPVVDEGHVGKQVYLPDANRLWYDFWTRREYQGGRSYHVDAPLHTLPLFVPAGTIVPMGRVLQDATTKATDLFFNIYSSGSSSYLLHMEDGETRSYRDGNFSTMRLSYDGQRTSGRLEIAKRVGSYVPPPRDLTIRFIAVDAPKEVEIDGALARWFYHPEDSGSITVKIPDDGEQHVVAYRA